MAQYIVIILGLLGILFLVGFVLWCLAQREKQLYKQELNDEIARWTYYYEKNTGMQKVACKERLDELLKER